MTSQYIYRLAQHAKNQRANLEVSAEASYVVKSFGSPTFSFTINVSEPKVVRSLLVAGCGRTPNPRFAPRPALLPQKIGEGPQAKQSQWTKLSEMYRDRGEQDTGWVTLANYQRRELSQLLEFKYESSVIETVGADERKLSQRWDLVVIIRLEPFMTWSKGAEPYINGTDGDEQIVYLEWQAIELNPKMHWKLPMSRVVQKTVKMPVEVEKSISIPKDSSISEETTPERSKRNRFKKN